MLALSFSAFDPTVWTGRALQAGCEQMEGVVLRICIRPLRGAFVAPGHYGYPRAPDLILGKALRGRLGQDGARSPLRSSMILIMRGDNTSLRFAMMSGSCWRRKRSP